MKRFKLLLLFAGLTLLLNCSKDEDSQPQVEQETDKSANLLATGDSAHDLLANTNFSNLLIEIGYVEGFQPSTTTMANFEDFLRDRTFKENITVQYLELPSPGKETLTLQEIADLETENRTAYNEGNTLAVYIYFADAPADGDDEEQNLVTLGSVYRNTSMVIYERTVRAIANRSALITISDVEEAVLSHEFGHLFGLVNLGSPMVALHEDAASTNHCDVAGCLMQAEIEFGGGLMGILESRALAGKGAAVPSLDAACLADLQANGGR
ncbi:hypothetical protein LVD13_07845 [Flavobacteriaceae bacterium D16]|nr:hypothetical protein [Flavobacteriaceae bacterium D16]